jgi:hypothetical protein
MFVSIERIIRMDKQDMSRTCGFKDAELGFKRASCEITDEEYDEYFDNNCGKCKYMCEICMYGE